MTKLHAAQGRVGERDVDVGLGEPTRQLAEAAGPADDVDDQHLAPSATRIPARRRSATAGAALSIVDQHVNDAPALARQGGKPHNFLSSALCGCIPLNASSTRMICT
jgi:hypothetical protein